MKMFSAEQRVSIQLRAAIENVLEYHERYQHCFLWTLIGNARNRQEQEDQFAVNNPAFTIFTGKGLIEVEPSLSISYKNFSYRLTVTSDGKKSNFKILKTLVEA